MKKAIILAAGLGKRLGKLTRDIPKCLLPIDESGEKTLIDYSLDTLSENNIQEILFVCGFAYEKLKTHVLKNWGNKFSFQFIFNDKYDKYNNIYSAYLAKDLWDDETVLLNSDIIFHPDIVNNLVETCHGKSLLVIDDVNKLDEEDMKVQIDNLGKIKKINKSLDIKSSLGEYIGITYLRGLERVKFLESLERNIKSKNLDLYYEDALADVLGEISVYSCSTEGRPWTEVDTKKDYEIAKQIAKEIRNPVLL